jgi:hypothetical protein
VKVRARRVKRPHRPGFSTQGSVLSRGSRGPRRDANAQIQMLPHGVYELDALQAVVILSRRVAAVLPEHAPYLKLRGVLVRAGDVAGVRPDATCCVAI